jgi:HD-like signal output (HDOD) protein
MGELEDLVEKTVSIPAVPQLLMRLQSVVADPKSSISDAIRIIEEDAGLGLRCLKIVNSAVYGLRMPCASLRHAGSVLGMTKLRDLALQSCLVAQFGHLRKALGFNIDLFWQHGAIAAIVARQVARNTRQFRGPMAETAASCGLLHNIGRLAMVDTFRATYLDVILPEGGHGQGAQKAEWDAFGFDHAQAGALLATKWNLSPELVATARDHHKPWGETPTLTSLVAFANEAAHAMLEAGDPGLRRLLECENARKLGIQKEAIDDIVREIAIQTVDATIVAA